MQPWIQITQLQKRIDNFELGPIDFAIEPGTITALVGNNGSGKSTLLKMMMNLVKQDKGEIKVFSKFVNESDESWKQNIAYQAQTAVGYDPFTGNALKNLISHWYPNWDEELFKKLVDLFQVPLTKRFGKLSQGSQQKLRLALTIASNARLLILDEPTSFMDIPSKKIFIDTLVDWMDKEERAIIIASHQAEDIRKLADYLVILHNGTMLGAYEKEELTESYQQYWFNETIPFEEIPGEISREQHTIVTNQAEATEQFLSQNQMHWTNRKALELDEVISLLLTNARR